MEPNTIFIDQLVQSDWPFGKNKIRDVIDYYHGVLATMVQLNQKNPQAMLQKKGRSLSAIKSSSGKPIFMLSTLLSGSLSSGHC